MLTSLSSTEILARIQLYRTEGIGPLGFFYLLNQYKTADNILYAIANQHYLSDKIKKILSRQPLYSPKLAEQELEQGHRFGATLLHFDQFYPHNLKLMRDCPPFLWVKGNMDLLKQRMVSIVGARSASFHGMNFSKQLARDLGQNKIVVVSGFARGIDAACHMGSLTTGTVAIFASGLDVIYPLENKFLYEKMLATPNLMVSEMPFGAEPVSASFRKRNRIIAGIGFGVVIVEGTLRSGTYLTAQCALDYNKEVFAVPGFPNDPRSELSNYLIKQGAKLVENANDIVKELTLDSNFTHHQPETVFHNQPIHKPNALLFESVQESTESEVSLESNYSDFIITESDNSTIVNYILESINYTPVAIEDLLSNQPFKTADFLSTLTELEILGKIILHPGQKVSL